MNFNYSYRAFLITSLLFGIVALLLFSIKLGSELPEEELSNYDIEYIPELPEPEPKKEISALNTTKRKIETNRAYNQAEKFIEDSDNLDEEKSFEERMSQLDEALYNVEGTNNGSINAAKERIENAKRKTSNTTGSKIASGKSANKNTTISYRLVDRTAIVLPNPVYTCEGGGKIVISITVDATGRITEATYNRASSTTTNGCLIDEALSYARQARFTTKSDKPFQLGSITYNFPGQD